MLLCFINLFLERFLELLLQKNNLNLTPDRIRHALAQVHTTTFEDKLSKKEGKMDSSLPVDAKKIFQVLGISTDSNTVLKMSVVSEFRFITPNYFTLVK